MLALAIGFLVHLLIRAFWAAAVGLDSIDSIGELDDYATIVFALSLGLAKLIAVLVLTVGVMVLAGWLIAVASAGAIAIEEAVLVAITLPLLPLMFATWVDSRRGKKELPAATWTERVLKPYAALGMSADSNLGLQMMVHRLSDGRRSYKGTVAVILLMAGLMLVVTLVPVVQQVGIGTLLKGGFPSLIPGQYHALRSSHYLDRMPANEALRVPVLPSEIAEGPWLRLFIPYVPHWHDDVLARCREAGRTEEAPGTAEPSRPERDWRHDAIASGGVLQCLANAMPVSVNEQPVGERWVFAEDRRSDRRGFVVMIDVRRLGPGRHALQVALPETAYGEDEPREPWRIPFWR